MLRLYGNENRVIITEGNGDNVENVEGDQKGLRNILVVLSTLMMMQVVVDMMKIVMVLV